MDETGPSIPESTALDAEDDVITADSSPRKAAADLRSRLANAKPVDSFTPTDTPTEPQNLGLLGRLREKIKGAREVQPGETIPGSKWFSGPEKSKRFFKGSWR